MVKVYDAQNVLDHVGGVTIGSDADGGPLPRPRVEDALHQGTHHLTAASCEEVNENSKIGIQKKIEFRKHFIAPLRAENKEQENYNR